MKHVDLTFDLYCHWGEKEPSYRIYVDNDLITERTFSWPGFQIFIRENVIVNLEPGKHSVRIENLDPTISKFEIKNVKVDNQSATAEFTID